MKLKSEILSSPNYAETDGGPELGAPEVGSSLASTYVLRPSLAGVVLEIFRIRDRSRIGDIGDENEIERR